MHCLVNNWQVNDVLGGVFNHFSREGSSFPELVILPHFLLDFVLLSVLDVRIGLQEVDQTYIVVFEVHFFLA